MGLAKSLVMLRTSCLDCGMHEGPVLVESVGELPAPASPERRPVAITVICIVNVLASIFLLPFLFTVTIRQTGCWYHWYMAVGGLLGLIVTLGLWKMKRWAFFCYLAYGVFDQAGLLAKGIWSAASLVVPLIFIGIVALYYKQLR